MSNSTIGRTLDQTIADLPVAQRRAIDKRANQLIAEELSLRELRRALGLTQIQVASVLDKAQHEISRIEQRGDMLLSTLANFVEAMGGELELVCRFKKRPPVRLRPPSIRKPLAPGAAAARRKGRRSVT